MILSIDPVSIRHWESEVNLLNLVVVMILNHYLSGNKLTPVIRIQYLFLSQVLLILLSRASYLTSLFLAVAQILNLRMLMSFLRGLCPSEISLPGLCLLGHYLI